MLLAPPPPSQHSEQAGGGGVRGLGRSPARLLLHWDASRSPQTQFEVIKRAGGDV